MNCGEQQKKVAKQAAQRSASSGLDKVKSDQFQLNSLNGSDADAGAVDCCDKRRCAAQRIKPSLKAPTSSTCALTV